MKKRGRPAKEEVLTVAQLALNQVEFVGRFTKIEAGLSQLVRGVDDFVTTANKINQDLAKRIQALEARCEDLEKKSISKEGEDINFLDEIEKDSEC